MEQWFQKQWSQYTFWHTLLLPISWVFFCVITVRKLLYKAKILKSKHLKVPVIVVGNINVGGTGKTPLVIWLAEQLILQGFKPGIISRGYGGSAKGVQAVLPNSNSAQVGDEPLLIAIRAHCPVFIGANRPEAGEALLKAHPECDIIISDDGLQHYALQRDVEVVVFDGEKQFGNGALLPAGPLRESIARLSNVDALVCNGKLSDKKNLTVLPFDIKNLTVFYRHIFGKDTLKLDERVIEMHLMPQAFYNLKTPEIKANIESFLGKKILAIAGIGNPARFFTQLKKLGLDFESHVYVDHYPYKEEDFGKTEADVILMTEKDAVKCKHFATNKMWVLPISADISENLTNIILKKLRA